MPKLALLALALALLAFAQASAEAPRVTEPLQAPAREAAVQTAAKELRARYIYPDVAEQVAAKIETNLAAGAYDNLTDRVAFAGRLTSDIASVAHDKHMRVTAAGGTQPPEIAKMGPPPRSEFGVVRADHLASGVGYIEINGFLPPEAFRPVADRAMAALSGSKGIIVDLRRNGGGSPASVAYLASFFFADAEPTHLNDLIWREAATRNFRTEAFQTTPTPTKFVDVPVYLLTSGTTFSGGEEFAYDMQTQKRAILVGDVTGGGANPGGTRPLGAGLTLFIPSGRAVNPITKTSWEGRGVKPEIAVPAEDALQTALARLGQRSDSKTIEALSRGQVFAPHTAPTPASEAAARRLVDEAATQQFQYELMSASLAASIREQLPIFRTQFATWGAVKSIAFREVSPLGVDIYDVTFANGGGRLMLALATDGTALLVSLRPS